MLGKINRSLPTDRHSSDDGKNSDEEKLESDNEQNDRNEITKGTQDVGGAEAMKKKKSDVCSRTSLISNKRRKTRKKK